MSSDGLYSRHFAAARSVLSAWFDDAKFRKAWKPEPGLFVTDHQVAIASMCAQQGAELDRDQLVYLLSRMPDWNRRWRDASEVYEQCEGTPSADPWQALEQLREIHALRALRIRLQEAARDIEAGKPLAEVRASVTEALRDTDTGSGVKLRTYRQVLETGLADLTRKDPSGGIPTLSKELDLYTGGLRSKFVWVIGAPTNWGKSSWAVGQFLQLRGQNRRSVIVTCEDEELLYSQRFMSAGTGADALRVRDRRAQYHELRAITDAVAHAGDEPCIIDVTGKPAETVAADIRSLVASERIDVVFVDYIQALRTKEKQQDRRNEVATVARLLTDAIKQSGAAGVLFSQITEDEKSGKRRIRESEDVEHGAEVVLFGISETQDSMNTDGVKRGKVEKKSFFVKKVKNGPKGYRVKLEWDPGSASFVSDYAASLPLPYEEGDYGP